MGLILWIDQNTFATGLLEKVFKKKNVSFYTITSVQDFVYLVADLKPELIVLDSVTAVAGLEALKQQYQASELLQGLPVILIEEALELNFLGNVIGKIDRPFDPFEIPEKIQRLLATN